MKITTVIKNMIEDRLEHVFIPYNSNKETNRAPVEDAVIRKLRRVRLGSRDFASHWGPFNKAERWSTHKHFFSVHRLRISRVFYSNGPLIRRETVWNRKQRKAAAREQEWRAGSSCSRTADNILLNQLARGSTISSPSLLPSA
jgi:hypothetical protein